MYTQILQKKKSDVNKIKLVRIFTQIKTRFSNEIPANELTNNLIVTL